jgi:hypothetical protein
MDRLSSRPERTPLDSCPPVERADLLVKEDAVLVANIVVETLPGQAQTVAERMGRIDGMGEASADGDHRVIATWSVPDNDTIEGLSEVLHAFNPEIVEVYPTLVSREE